MTGEGPIGFGRKLQMHFCVNATDRYFTTGLTVLTQRFEEFLHNNASFFTAKVLYTAKVLSKTKPRLTQDQGRSRPGLNQVSDQD